MSQRGFQGLVLALAGMGWALMAALILMRTGGMLIYTLDDPYIHLALAEEILRGGYGINPGEAASPSSSMLYAPVLAPFLALGLGSGSALVLSLAGEGAVLWLLAGLLAPFVDQRRPLALIAAPLLVLAINGFALPFTGMEHPLHAAASVAVVLGVARAATGRVPGWLVPVIVLAAAIRFEGYALALTAILVLAALRQTRAAVAAALGLGVLTLAYAGTMQALGLPLLPSSVLVKSAVSAAAVDADAGHTLMALIVHGARALAHPWGMTFAALTLIFATLVLRRASPREVRAVAALGVGVLGAHLLVGRFGWFGRYEVYAVATLIAVSLVALRARASRLAVARLAVFGLAGLGAGYATVTVLTPAAAQGVFQQQYQMHRFAVDFFAHPVAVNDLGWVAYANDARVIDLWGLGSEAARRLTADQGRTVATVTALTEGQAEYAMIYAAAFPGAIPADWCRMADLRTSRISAAADTVGFYLINRAREAEMRAALTRFAPGLPDGATLTPHPCEP